MRKQTGYFTGTGLQGPSRSGLEAATAEAAPRPPTHMKTVVAVIQYEVEEGCDTCEVRELPNAITAALSELDREEHRSRLAGGTVAEPDYRFKDLTVYGSLADLLADAAEGLTKIGEGGFCTGYQPEAAENPMETMRGCDAPHLVEDGYVCTVLYKRSLHQDGDSDAIATNFPEVGLREACKRQLALELQDAADGGVAGDFRVTDVVFEGEPTYAELAAPVDGVWTPANSAKTAA